MFRYILTNDNANFNYKLNTSIIMFLVRWFVCLLFSFISISFYLYGDIFNAGVGLKIWTSARHSWTLINEGYTKAIRRRGARDLLRHCEVYSMP